MARISLVLSFVFLFAASARWIGHAEQDDQRFTGRTDTLDSKDLSIARRSFEPGARSAWHSHEKGQLLFVEEGRARVQTKGQPMKELGVGQTDYVPPNVAHWHGAAPDHPFVQINVGFGGQTKWMEKVTDAEYTGR